MLDGETGIVHTVEVSQEDAAKASQGAYEAVRALDLTYIICIHALLRVRVAFCNLKAGRSFFSDTWIFFFSLFQIRYSRRNSCTIMKR